MERVARHDPRAQRELVHRLMARVRRTSRALVREASDADDAAQVALLEVLSSAGKFRAEGSIESWADRITVRTTLRYLKKQAREHARMHTAPDVDAIPTQGGSLDLSESVAGEVTDYLSRLSEAKRTALVLRHVLDYSIDEIAQLTQVSRNTVKDRLVSARQDFRRLVRQGQVTGRRKVSAS